MNIWLALLLFTAFIAALHNTLGGKRGVAPTDKGF